MMCLQVRIFLFLWVLKTLRLGSFLMGFSSHLICFPGEAELVRWTADFQFPEAQEAGISTRGSACHAAP